MSDKYKIIALFGKAGAGKDFIQKEIMKTDFGKNNLHEIVSSTTRPPREGEIEGVNYHFIPNTEKFFNKDNAPYWVEFVAFRGWWYGTSKKHLSEDKINIGVFNIKGIDIMLLNKEIQCIPIFVDASDKTRLLRQLTRENNPDCLEICRRFIADHDDFVSIPFPYYAVENDEDEITSALNTIQKIIYENDLVKIN